MPKVSVIIPCYNHGAYLPEALDSVQKQTFHDYEVIVVNDGSTDAETVRVLQNLELPKTRIIHTANYGVSAARNRGIKEAQGTYILPLDADDRIASSYLEKAVAVLDDDIGVGVIYCESSFFGGREAPVKLPDYDPRALLVSNMIFSAAMYRKSDWLNVGGYSEKMVYGWEDWDFWIAIATLGKKVVKLPDELFYYRVRDASRDHSLTYAKKSLMFCVMVFRHKSLYAKNIFYVVNKMLRGTKSARDSI